MTSKSQSQDAVAAIARHLREHALELLTTRALERLLSEEPTYAELRMDPDQRRDGMYRTLDLALQRIAGESLPELPLRATTHVGRERAEQSFPLPALMHSYQLDMRILWEAVLEEGHRRGLSTDQEFVDGLIRVWEAVDANSVEAVTAYRQTERELAGHRTEIRARAFERLLADGEQDSGVVHESGPLLGLAVHQPQVVFVARTVPTASSELTAVRTRLQRTNLPFYLGWVDDELVGIVQRGRRPVREIVGELESLSTFRCGVAAVSVLDQAMAGVRHARAVIRAHGAPGVRLIDDVWISTVVGASDELGARMARSIVEPIVRAREREALLETLRSFLEVGSISSVAESTYRHRNTVRNRLRTVEQITGLDLTVPDQVTRLTMAVRWLDSPEGQSFIDDAG